MTSKNDTITRLIVAAVLITALAIVHGCATYNVNLSHKQAATWMNSIFNAQDTLYKQEVRTHNTDVDLRPDETLTDEEMEARDGRREFLRAKKRILDELQPLLDTYSTYVATGTVPPQQVEAQAIRLVNELLKLLED